MSYQPLFLGLGTAVISTDSNNNRLRGETADLRLGQAVKFVVEGNNLLFGGVVANTVYYIKEIIDSEYFTVSATLEGDVLELTDGEGFMLVRSIQQESIPESLRKVDSMLEEVYLTGIAGDGVGILSVAEDTNPRLGGDLDLNDSNIGGAGNISISGSINATTISGDLRGIVAGGLIGPVDEEGVRIGNPTIDGLPFELGSPQANQIIAWSAVDEKFVLASLNAASGLDTLDDVLFRGNTSTYSINVNGVTTTSLTVTNGIDYADLINTPTLFSGDYADLTGKPTLFSGDYNDLTNKPTIPTNTNQLTNGAGFITTNGIPSQSGNSGKYLTTDGSTLSWATVSGGGGGTGLGSRTTASATTGALAINGVGNISITGFKTYALLAMTVEIPAWVRLYTTAAARTADASRLETQDPQPGSGVIAEVITTSNNQTVLFTPATLGFNGDVPAATTIYASVKNKGTGVATIEVTLTLVQLEA